MTDEREGKIELQSAKECAHLYPYHVVLTMKAKNQRLRRSAKEKNELHSAKECAHMCFTT